MKAVALKMFSPINYKICSYPLEPLRYLSQGSLVVGRSSKISVSRKSTKQVIMKLPSKKVLEKICKNKAKLNDEENVWLKSLSLENLKLYWKTPRGSFRVIDNNKLLEKLSLLKPLEVENKTKNESVESPVQLPDIKNESVDPPKQLASVKPKNSIKPEIDSSLPKPSDYLIKNMLDFPFLMTDFENSKLDKSEKLSSCSTKDIEEKEINSLPSVTKILTETMSGEAKFRLNLWRTKLIEELGESGFLKHRKDPDVSLEMIECNKMFVETKRKRIIVDLMNQGAKFHGSIKQYLKEGKEEVKIDPEIEGCWKSLENCLPDISDVKLLEQPLCHPLLLYRGIVDCVASYRNVPCVIEWKKSDKRKPDLKGTFDAPIQICAYMGALSWAQNLNLTPLKSGLVVVAYTDGSPADLFPMNLETCENYWIEWLRRLQGFWAQRSSVSFQREPTKNLLSECL